MYSKEIIKGTLKPIILSLLLNSDKMYGYEITQKVKELTDGKIAITEGALYPLLHKLEADGIVTTERVLIGKRARKYYRLTTSGREVTSNLIDEFLDFVSTVGKIIEPNGGLSHGVA